MKKTEVYVILEEILENGRSFYDVDIQVLDGSTANRKTRFNQLAKARANIDTQIKQEFDVITVQELLKQANHPKKETEKTYKRDIFPPTYIVHEIAFESFKEELATYLTDVKKWDTPYTLSFEAVDETNQQGEIYFFIDIDALQEADIDALEKEYDDNIAFIDFLQIFLEDMFETRELEYAFNAYTEELIVKIPFHLS